jgi:adenylate kinase
MNEKKEFINQDNFKIPVSVVFLGPPASGKGTTASFLEQKLNIKSISPGNIFKNIRNNNNELSKLVIDATKNGGLCPDWLTNELVKNESIKNINLGFNSISLDGYPRTIDQLNFLLKNFDVKMFVNSDTDFSKLKKMVVNRRNCKECKKVFSTMYDFQCDKSNFEFCAKKSEANWEIRWDDTEEFFEKRYSVFKTETIPVIEKVKNFKNYFELDLLNENNYKIIESVLTSSF